MSAAKNAARLKAQLFAVCVEAEKADWKTIATFYDEMHRLHEDFLERLHAGKVPGSLSYARVHGPPHECAKGYCRNQPACPVGVCRPPAPGRSLPGAPQGGKR